MDAILSAITNPGAFEAFLFNPRNALLALAAVSVFASVMAVAEPMIKADRLQSRLKSVADRRERLRRQNRRELEEGGKSRPALRNEAKGFTGDLVKRLQLDKLLEDTNLKTKLMQAGLRGQRPVATFYFFRFALPFIFFGAGSFYLNFVNNHDLTQSQSLFAAFVGAYLGYYAPGVYLTNVAQKRRDSIMRVFPDALDLLLICVEAGMSIEAAFQKVASELGEGSIELAEEFSLTTAELSYLQDRRQAFENLSKRTNHPGVQGVATALIQSERYGTPVGSALRVMAKENRDLRMTNAEKKAASLPAQLTVPMILFFLPVLFVVILGPIGLRVSAQLASG
ncbi:MAG: type II secretion system F family protein [Maricaulaceae bacterium]